MPHIVDDVKTVIDNIPFIDDQDWPDFSTKGNRSGEQKSSILVISIPYLTGFHIAEKPSDFIPVIDHLVALHDSGFVHGDIRGYNIIVRGDSDEKSGYLIDFDFGGFKIELPAETEEGYSEEIREAKYPSGYRTELVDGNRKGKFNEKIMPWHDWYALGRLIFDIHKLMDPPDREVTLEEESYVRRMKDFWLDVKQGPSATGVNIFKYSDLFGYKMINDEPADEANANHLKYPSAKHIGALKHFLAYTTKNGWTVSPKEEFVETQTDSINKNMLTRNGGTGSPIKPK
jgi:serine/threonine protein kinase